jgi:hypothetical protein
VQHYVQHTFNEVFSLLAAERNLDFVLMRNDYPT